MKKVALPSQPSPRCELTIKGDIEVLRLQPGDTIVVSVDDRIDRDTLKRWRDVLEERFPNHPVVVTSGAQITVHRQDAT